MRTLILLEKRTYLLKLVQLFNQKQEWELKELKQKIPSATFYTYLLSKLLDINKILAGRKPSYFIKPNFMRKDGRVVHSLQKHPEVIVEISDEFIILKHEKD